MKHVFAVVATLVLASVTTFAPAPLSAQADKGALAGKTIVIDPGHQLGNSRFTGKINKTVNAKYGVRKKCNTTGTATNNGYPEATFNWKVAVTLKKLLEREGATVVMTRSSNSRSAWGPCITKRGTIGNKKADLLVSIHGDGASRSSQGFHIIMPKKNQGTSKYRSSQQLGKQLKRSLKKAGFNTANYVKNGLRYSNYYGTINWSKKPAVLVELGNMRNPHDARLMSSAKSQKRYAQALAQGICSYLD